MNCCNEIGTLFLKPGPKLYQNAFRTYLQYLSTAYLPQFMVFFVSFFINLTKFLGKPTDSKTTQSQCLVRNIGPYSCYISDETHFCQNSVYLYQDDYFLPVAQQSTSVKLPLIFDVSRSHTIRDTHTHARAHTHTHTP
jgi:hypothetical protein